MLFALCLPRPRKFLPTASSTACIPLWRWEVPPLHRPSTVATISVAGFILQENYGGSYTIGSDCTAMSLCRYSFRFSHSFPVSFVAALAEAGNSMRLIVTEPLGTDLRIVLQGPLRPSCSNSGREGGMRTQSGWSKYHVSRQSERLVCPGRTGEARRQPQLQRQ